MNKPLLLSACLVISLGACTPNPPKPTPTPAPVDPTPPPTPVEEKIVFTPEPDPRFSLPGLSAYKTERGLVITLEDSLFADQGTHLQPSAIRHIEKIALFLRRNPMRNLYIEGHSDKQNKPQYERYLAQRRADAVHEALTQRGIAPRRIIARGFGSQQPIADNNTLAGQRKNRRVEIVILKEGEILQ